MKKKFDLLVFVGRFQIFHDGHCAVIERALELSDKVLILIGSTGQARSLRNPFTFNERSQLINECFSNFDCRVIVQQIEDSGYSNLVWMANVQRTVRAFTPMKVNNDAKVGMIGHSKDNSSFYLKLFPQWESVSVDNVRDINSTDLRRTYFSSVVDEKYRENFTQFIPSENREFYALFRASDDYKNMVAEYDFSEKYKGQFSDYPYPPTFQCVDAIVIQSGHVLLIKRKELPGKGLLALPGGFVNPEETLEDSMFRELKEETCLNVPRAVLEGGLKGVDTFDMVHRSTRGRTFTQAFFIRLRDDVELEYVKGADDAEKAMWLPIGELSENEVFEDHYAIIWKMIHKYG